MIFFAADFHLSHKNILKYCNRPFKNIEDMNKTILQNIEESIRPKDILYFLGDLRFKELNRYMSPLLMMIRTKSF